MKNSNDLLDYEANDVQRNEITTKQEGYLTRETDDIRFTQQLVKKDEKALLGIEIYYNNFTLKFPTENKKFLNETPYFVIKYMSPIVEENTSLVHILFNVGIQVITRGCNEVWKNSTEN